LSYDYPDVWERTGSFGSKKLYPFDLGKSRARKLMRDARASLVASP